MVRPCHSRDVAAVVRFAARTGVDLAVRSGGHSIAGHSTSEGGLVIDLRSMAKVDVDPASRTAWVETGATDLRNCCYFELVKQLIRCLAN